MRLADDEARRRLGAARVARLATVGGPGSPHLVPVTFAVAGDRIYTAVDAKPKTTRDLRRLRNIRENPMVAVLADHYDEDWSRLWWVRAELRWQGAGTADRAAALAALLAGRYPQYQDQPFARVLVLHIVGVAGWAADDR